MAGRHLIPQGLNSPSLLDLEHPSFLPRDFDGSQAFGLNLGLAALAPLVPRPLGLDQNHTIHFPWASGVLTAIEELLPLHNHVSRSLVST